MALRLVFACALISVASTGFTAGHAGGVPTLASAEAEQRDEQRKLLEGELTKPYTIASLPSLRALAETLAQEKNFVAAAATYHEILLLIPDDRDALRGRVFATLSIGAPHRALAYAMQHPQLFSSDEVQKLKRNAVDKSIQWGKLEAQQGNNPQRFERTDKALVEGEDILARAVSSDDPNRLGASFDRIVALRDRVRMDEAVSLYEQLKQSNADIPAYALAAAADAYLSQREPEKARDLYLQALALARNDPDYPNREWQFGLFDAYIDANQVRPALELATQLTKEIAPRINRGLPGVELDDDFYGRARVNVALARLNADELKESERELDKVLGAAPFNTDARLASADLSRAREHPRTAQDQYASLLTDEPSNVYAAVGIAETALTLHEPGTAQTQIAALMQNYPENLAVQRAKRELSIYNRPSLSVQTESGRSATGGGNRGNRDWLFDTMLYSAPLAGHWRVFGHTFLTQAKFEDETLTRRRVGVGGDYRARTWEFSGEVDQDARNFDATGVSLRAAWLPNDHWKLDVEFQSNSNDIPLRADAEGTRIKATKFSAAYTHNESRSFDASFGDGRFSDGNRRAQFEAGWFERWVSGPIYKLDTRVAIGASHNSLDDTVYFNPHRDASFEVTAVNEWQLWHRYERSFKHRLALGLGQYRQQDFGTKLTSTLRYEQEWNFDSYRSLRYGVVHARQPFDGVQDKRTFLFLNLNWHF